MQLEPCPACHRHVRIDEKACPFCATDLTSAMAAIPTRPLPGQRLGRAALMSFGLTVGAGTIAGCEIAVPVYGAPLQPQDGSFENNDDEQDATTDAGKIDAGKKDAGAADAGADAGSDAGRDAGKDAGLDASTVDGGPLLVPIYGVSRVEPSSRPRQSG